MSQKQGENWLNLVQRYDCKCKFSMAYLHCTLGYCSFFMTFRWLPSPLPNTGSDISPSYCLLLFLGKGHQQFLFSFPCRESSFPSAASYTPNHIHVRVLSKIPSPAVPLPASLPLTQQGFHRRMAGSPLSCQHETETFCDVLKIKHLLLPINTCHLGLLFLTLEDEAAKTAQDREC